MCQALQHLGSPSPSRTNKMAGIPTLLTVTMLLTTTPWLSLFVKRRIQSSAWPQEPVGVAFAHSPHWVPGVVAFPRFLEAHPPPQALAYMSPLPFGLSTRVTSTRESPLTLQLGSASSDLLLHRTTSLSFTALPCFLKLYPCRNFSLSVCLSH